VNRVIDLPTGQLGTVVDAYGEGSRRRYRVAWDEPTPYEDQAWVVIPCEFFDWAPEDTSTDA
jgi:hypothetical protein